MAWSVREATHGWSQLLVHSPGIQRISDLVRVRRVFVPAEGSGLQRRPRLFVEDRVHPQFQAEDAELIAHCDLPALITFPSNDAVIPVLTRHCECGHECIKSRKPRHGEL